MTLTAVLVGVADGAGKDTVPVVCVPAPPVSFYRYRSRVCPGYPRCLFTGTGRFIRDVAKSPKRRKSDVRIRTQQSADVASADELVK
jgi:hypothetical protein